MSSNRRQLAALALAASMAACVDGRDPAGLEGPRDVVLQAAAVFDGPAAVDAAISSELGPLTRARVTARNATTGAVVGLSVVDIAPDDPEWVLRVTVTLSNGQSLPVSLQVELASVDTVAGTELVQWSGRTPTVNVSPANEFRSVPEVRLVNLYQGPADDLDATGIALSAPEGLSFGYSATVTSTIDGGGPNKMAFYKSLNPSVVTVHPLTGFVETVDTGSARLVAVAGPVADTVSFFVVAPPEPESGEAVATAASSVSYSGKELAAGMEDAAGAANIASTLAALSDVLAGDDVIASIRAFRRAVEALDGYGADSERLRYQDGPQLSLIRLSLIHVADALGVPFN